MRLKLFGRDIIIGKDITGYSGQSDDLFTVLAQKYGVDYTSRNKLEAYKNVVYACVNLIGEQAGAYEPEILKKNKDQWEDIGEHELLQLLRRPGGRDLQSESFSQFELLEATLSFLELQGDCFWYMALGKTTGKPREIVVLRPDKVGTDIDKKTGKINGYFVRQSYGDPIPLEVNEVLRFKLFNPKTGYKGLGRVEAGSDYIGTDESTAKYTKNFFANNAALSGVLNIKGEVTKGAFRKFVRAWRDKYEGVDNAGKVAILRDSDANFTKVGLGLGELDMTALRKMSMADVCMLFRVPPELLGKVTEGSGLGRGNIETLEYIFSKYNINPKFDRMDAVLQFALERYWGDNKLKFSHENIIPEDKEHELNVRNLLTDKVFTRNEMRAEEGLDPIKGGDELYVPFNSLPISEATTAPAADTSSQASAGGMKIKFKRVIKTGVAASQASKEAFRLRLMRNQAKYERQYKKVLRPIFTDQRKEALENLEAHASDIKKQGLFDDSVYDEQMVAKLKPMLVDLAQTQGGIALVFAGDTEHEFLMTAKIESFIVKNTSRMAQNFNDETIKRLNASLAEGIKAGEGLGALKKRVNDVFDNIEGYRSARLARTETLKASNNATEWAYKQTGYVTGKEWTVNPDACPECGEFDGKTVPLDEAFLGLGQSYTFTDENGDEQEKTNDYDTVETPPLHPNCRCTIIPVR